MSVLDISIVNVAIPTIQNNGVIDHEASVMLILFYPQSLAGDVNKKIDEIRALYNKGFNQESVLREEEQPSCVSF